MNDVFPDLCNKIKNKLNLTNTIYGIIDSPKTSSTRLKYVVS